MVGFAVTWVIWCRCQRRCPIAWVKTADEIQDSVRWFGVRVQQVHGR